MVRLIAGVAQLARASAFQAEGRGFESRRPLNPKWDWMPEWLSRLERVLGKDEVPGSIPGSGLTFIFMAGTEVTNGKTEVWKEKASR